MRAQKVDIITNLKHLSIQWFQFVHFKELFHLLANCIPVRVAQYAKGQNLWVVINYT